MKSEKALKLFFFHFFHIPISFGHPLTKLDMH